MKNLRELNLINMLNKIVLKEKKPILGICLGMQLMCKESYEFGHHTGLGWIDASVIRLNPKDKKLRVPHVGWDDLIQVKNSLLFNNIPKDALFYYVHSFHTKCNNKDIIFGECEYEEKFTSVIQQNNIYATQFHPEKSQLHGLNLLKNFLEKG